MNKNKKNISVVELFAGVGGFRLGLENCSNRYKTIWANQWEPSKKSQHAFDCYCHHFGSENAINEDIHTVRDNVPKHDLLVGGFPCQDYSVARTQAKGIEGKKGVLWWDIQSILQNKRPPYVLLENVDRLIKSPASQRGRDFGVMLRCFHDLGYSVEWRIVNAAEYGFAQKRRRIFIFAFQNTLKHYSPYAKAIGNDKKAEKIILENGFFAKTFPVLTEIIKGKINYNINITQESYVDLEKLSDNFSAKLYNSGFMANGFIYSQEVIPVKINPTTLGSIRHTESVKQDFFLNGALDKWIYLKGAKKVPRVKPNGEEYFYAEGSMKFPDDLNSPARTMLTSESSVNRSTHVIEDKCTGELRLLTPIECERINGFPDNWTDTGMPFKFRYFVMGNALVVPLITKLGETLLDIIDKE